MPGPLHGLVVTELAGLGPAPFAGMVLADLGARVIRFDRTKAGRGVFPAGGNDLLDRGRESVSIDLKNPDGVEVVLRSAAISDAFIEGFRPGVTERLGVGPADCLARNPGLVYGRMTGWGQTGPWASMAGHDIDYIALSGALHPIGPAARPVPPLNLVGDFGGGGMLLVVGLLAALMSARATGEGQVVDAAMVDGAALLTTSHHGFVADGWWQTSRESNLLDGGAPFYRTYETSDGEHVAVGALEPQFFAALLDGLGLDAANVGSQYDRSGWEDMQSTFASIFIERTRDEWGSHFAGTDACVAPVLSLTEARTHRHNVVRSTFVEVDGVFQPGPAPRFSGTPTGTPTGPVSPGAHTDSVLSTLDFTPAEIAALRTSGAVA